MKLIKKIKNIFLLWLKQSTFTMIVIEIKFPLSIIKMNAVCVYGTTGI